MPTVNDIAEGFCNRGTARLQSGTGELRLCPQAQHWVAEFLGPKNLTRQRDRCDISPFKGRRDNLVSERDRETKVSINSAITFIKSPDLVFALWVVQTCKIPVMSEEQNTNLFNPG